MIARLAFALLVAGCGAPGERVDAAVTLDAGSDAASCVDDGGPIDEDAGLPARAQPGSCTADEINQYIAGCLDEATALVIRCEQFAGDHATCAACLQPPADSTTFGPVLQHPGGIDVNYAGCRALRPTQVSCDPCIDRGDPLVDLRVVAQVFCGG